MGGGHLVILGVGLALGADTLWYTGNDGDPYAAVTGIEAVVGSVDDTDTFPADLTPYRLVFLATPQDHFDTSPIEAMGAWVADGGILVLVGEHVDFADLTAVNDLMIALGRTAQLEFTRFDCSGSWSATAATHSLSVGSPGYSCSNDIFVDTSEVIYTGSSGQTLAVEERGVVLLADSNLVVDDVPYGADNAAFVQALHEASCAGIGDRDGDGDDAIVCGGTDCDDGDASVYSGAAELCDGADQDCDGTVDEDATDAETWYSDEDGDGSGDPAESILACEQDAGLSPDNLDCDDTSVRVHPDATETCDGVDEDCDGAVDEDAVDPTTWSTDADGDGHGDPALLIVACDAPAGAVPDADDCDDTRPDVFPGAAEVCDGLDQDCDDITDELALDATTWSSDYDGDGHGGGDVFVSQCDAPAGYASVADDCDDHDDAVYPGADELCDDRDNDCDEAADEDAVDATTWYADTDSDGWGDDAVVTVSCTRPTDTSTNGGDCDDADRDLHPEADETCDGRDEDCDGLTDEDLPLVTWYTDEDGDGLGDAGTAAEGCVVPEGAVTEAGDCDDGDPDRTTDCTEAEEDPDDKEAPGGCGCSASPAGAGGLLGLLGLLTLRRRR